MSKVKKLINNGYIRLRNQNNLDYLIKLSNSLAIIPLTTSYNLFGMEKKLIEKCTLQFLLQRRLYLIFNKNILAALGRKDKELKLGLPKAWLSHLEKIYDFKSLTATNYFRWIGFILFWYAYGVFKILNYCFSGILRNKKIISRDFVYFDNLSHKSIPQEPYKSSETIIDWYKKYIDSDNLDIYHDCVELESFKYKESFINPTYIPFKVNLSNIEWLKFLFHSFYVSIYSFFAFLKGDFSYAILLKEYPLLYLSKKIKKENFAKKYFFHNSTHIFRPLWTYEAEKKGSEIIFYYYSTNNEFLKFEKGRIKNFDFPQHMSWTNFLVWNKYQSKYVKDYLPKANVRIVGPIWFESSSKSFPKLDYSKKIISIFDVQPFKEERYQLLGFPDRYWTTDVVKKFQKDIHEVFKNKDVIVILKRKRDVADYNDQSYISLVNEQFSSEKFLQIDPNFSASKLIDKSFLTISFPITSTANISKHKNINTIYYDPTSKLDKNDTALSGIRLIKGINELDEYVTNELEIKNERKNIF